MTDSLRDRALRLLARREYARVELQRKLAPLAESPEQLGLLLNDLQARRLLSDERYAEMRVSARAGRFGNARLADEMRRQGVADEVVAEALAASDDELSRAQAVWTKKYGNLPVTDPAEKAKRMRFLASRGFSAESIRRVMRGDFDD